MDALTQAERVLHGTHNVIWSDGSRCDNMSHLVGKPTMWFPNRSDTNQPVQAQERARSLKFRI